MTMRMKRRRMMGRVKRSLCHLRRSPNWAPKEASLSQLVLRSDSLSAQTLHRNDQTCKQIEWMKATPLCQRVTHRGADCERIRKPPQTSPDSFIQVPIRRPGAKKKKKNVWKVGQTSESWGEKITLKRSSADSDSMKHVGVWLFRNWRKRPHTKTHIQADWNPRELAGSDHNPLPPRPPLREGHHSGPDGSANSDPEPQLAPHPLLRIHFLPVPFYFFSPLLFLPLFCLLLFVPPPPLFFKLVYRTRREAACGKELSLLSFDDVISVVVPQRTFFLLREKSQQFLHDFLFFSLFVSQSFSCFL